MTSKWEHQKQGSDTLHQKRAQQRRKQIPPAPLTKRCNKGIANNENHAKKKQQQTKQNISYLVATEIEVFQHGVEERFDRKFGVYGELQFLAASLDFGKAVLEYSRTLLKWVYIGSDNKVM